MSLDDLKIRLTEQRADFEIMQHDIPIKSKNDALGYFKLEETAPTLIVKSESDYYALIISGERSKVDFEPIKGWLGCDVLKMANKREIAEKFNLETGQIPLVGHDLACIIDNRIFKHRFVYGGTGDWYYTLKIKPDDLLKANNVILRFD